MDDRARTARRPDGPSSRRDAFACVDCGTRPIHALGRCHTCYRANGHAGNRYPTATPAAWHQPPPWTVDAPCTDDDPELWFTDTGPAAAIALSVCDTCPVRRQCLDYALHLGEVWHGIWGGLTPAQRRAELEHRNAATGDGERVA